MLYPVSVMMLLPLPGCSLVTRMCFQGKWFNLSSSSGSAGSQGCDYSLLLAHLMCLRAIVQLLEAIVMSLVQVQRKMTDGDALLAFAKLGKQQPIRKYTSAARHSPTKLSPTSKRAIVAYAGLTAEQD